MCLNLKSGGEKCTSYSEETLDKFSKWERTDEMKKRMSESAKGRKAWNKGLPSTTKGKHRLYLDDGSFIMVK